MTLPGAPSHPHRLVYLGTPAVAVPPLLALHKAGFEIPLVVSRPDKRRGRGSTKVASPVKAAAEDLGIPVSVVVEDAVDVKADLGVVVAFGRLIATPILEMLPMVNLHFSLLPRWRGAAPVERAILAGDATTGVCLMAVAEALDTGDVYATRQVDIGEDDTLDDLRRQLVSIGSTMLVEELTAGLGPPKPQVGEPSYAAKLEPGDHRLDFDRSALELHRVVRLGRAWCLFRDKRLKVLETEPVGSAAPDAASDAPSGAGIPGQLVGTSVVTADGRLRLLTVQPEGRKPMAAPAWLNGVRPEPGERLG